MELTFFIAACVVKWFRFVAKTEFYHSNGLSTADQCLHSIQAFAVSHGATSMSRLGLYEQLGGDTAN